MLFFVLRPAPEVDGNIERTENGEHTAVLYAPRVYLVFLYYCALLAFFYSGMSLRLISVSFQDSFRSLFVSFLYCSRSGIFFKFQFLYFLVWFVFAVLFYKSTREVLRLKVVS